MINLGTNPYPWPIDGRLGDPDPLRRAERLRDAGLSIEHSGPFAYQVVDLDHGPVGYRRTWSGAEELAHQYADLRERRLTDSFPGAGRGLAGRPPVWRP